MERKPSSLARLPDALVAVGLLVATFVLYLPTLSHGIIDFDDPTYVQRPIVMKGLSAAGFRWAFTATVDANWFPLTWLSHMLDAQLFGQNWGAQHATSVLLHSINASLVFLFFRMTTAARWRSALVAALFAIHPLRVESVSWLAERKDVLCATFFLLTLLAYAWYMRGPSCKRYALVLLGFTLALMSKPMAVTLPLILLLLDYWPIAAGQRPARRHETRIRLVEKVPLFLLSAISCLITMLVQRRGGAMKLAASFTLIQRIENAIVVIVRYIGKTFRPMGFSIYYPHPGSWPIAIVIGSLALIVALSAIAIVLRRRAPYLLVGWFGFVLMLVPVLGVVQVGLQSMADRYTYLPSIFLLLAIVWALADLSDRFGVKPSLAAIPVGCAMLFLSVATWYQQSYWRDTYALFSHALAVDPDNSYAECVLGTTLSNSGNDSDALPHFERALVLDSSDPMFHYAYAASLNRMSRADDAIREYQETIRLRPDFTPAYYLLAMTLGTKGNYAAAEPYFKKAAELSPREAKIQIGWAQALAAQNRTDEANEHFAKAYELRGNAEPPE